MPRANRHYLPDRVWHLTHRCHKREFLLKFARDRRRWTAWLFEAKKRYGLKVLNFVVTSNHVHLLVFADSDRLAIPRAMQQSEALTEAIRADEHHARGRRPEWTQGLAVGSLPYIQDVQRKLGINHRHRHTEEAGDDGTFVLREEAGAYTVNNGDETDALRFENARL